MTKVCEYFFAPQSPWSYLGHARLMQLVATHDVKLELKPMDLGRVFGTSGGLPLAKRPPQRQAYRLLELERWSKHLGLAMNIQPKFFPVAGDPAAKLIIATQLAHGTCAAVMLTGAIMHALWAEEKNIADEETLIALVNKGGHDGQALLQASHADNMQKEYDRFTDQAIEADVFGAPWYVVDDEAFWGQDRLDFVAAAFARETEAK